MECPGKLVETANCDPIFDLRSTKKSVFQVFKAAEARENNVNFEEKNVFSLLQQSVHVLIYCHLVEFKAKSVDTKHISL